MPAVPGAGEDAAGLRAANAGLRELLAERDAEIAVLRGQVAELAGLRARAAELAAEAAGLQAQVTDLAARVGQNSKNSSRPPSSDGPAARCQAVRRVVEAASVVIRRRSAARTESPAPRASVGWPAESLTWSSGWTPARPPRSGIPEYDVRAICQLMQ